MSSLFDVTDSSAPDVAVEIAAGRVSGASIEWRGARASVVAHAVEPLPAAALVPSLTAQNALDRPSVMTALNRVLEKIGRPRRVALVVPDAVAKVSLVRFEKVPPRAADLDQLVRWQVRKTAPFPIEEAQVSHVRGMRFEEGHEFIVSLARASVIREYEALCEEGGAHAGLVDIATFNVINCALTGAIPDASTDWLLVNVASDSVSIAILRGADLIFFRNRTADTEGTLADLVHQTAMYYEDRLHGGGLTRALLAGTSDHADEIRTTLRNRLGTAVEPVDPRTAAALTDRISASPAFLDALVPLVGLLVRDRQAVPA